MHVRYSPLAQQFADPEEIFAELRELVRSGDFTLGKPVAEFEAMFAEAVGVRHAIGVGSGTDALKLPLKALGLGPGDEVITCANTFWATVGAIAEIGAKPVFVDCDDSFGMDLDQIEAAITPRTRAIMPVHLTGDVLDMPRLMAIAERHGLPVVEDGCQSLLGEIDGKRVGTFGVAAGFSMHPLKIINVWGDAGIVVTNDDEMNRRLRLLRNHGLKNRDEMEILGYNSRLDSVQAVVGKWIVRQLPDIAHKRGEAARYYDVGFADLSGVRIPPRNLRTRNVYLLYILFAERRDELLAHCVANGVEAKVHYPIPVYRQKALEFLGHRDGDFPVTDRHAREVITFPVDQHLSRAELDHVISTVRNFYRQA
ncbi:DegT/DnrJ/EryC1/StrS family aminotransferase [Azospirillum griseum]|uniref:DegT/DnrJ/EryC1/StrS family aminotransferase n=1 Tax=Azospirillum griseum TaxID=2496639 RepID=A0A3S0IBV4_9PROT|nr:DegT/DnrJ/EryC1/StrS family aminotransferase [Azospirillum griseum]RTR15552.1 DegT/DnrJ/EryC1/StrS family aminotransferase [Azospirillum griseum]